jgi:hypothetical protein
MNELISHFHSTSSLDQNKTAPSRVLCFRASPHDPNHIVVHPIDYPVDVPPLYTLISSKTAQPNLMIFQGSPDSTNLIDDTSFHSLSSKTDLTIRGQGIRMTLNQLTGNFSLESPTAGNLKWNVGKIMGSSFTLKDNTALKLAHLRSSGFPASEERELEIFVNCDDRFLELVVVSGIAAKMFAKEANEVASEIIKAVAGV